MVPPPHIPSINCVFLHASPSSVSASPRSLLLGAIRLSWELLLLLLYQDNIYVRVQQGVRVA